MTRQPEWKFAGHIGDVDPIAYGGGFVYSDVSGNFYPPEMSWFEPSDDNLWHNLEEKTPVTVYRLVLDRGVFWTRGSYHERWGKYNRYQYKEWWFRDLPALSRSTGIDETELWKAAMFGDTMERAWLYYSLIGYFGPHEFDSYPIVSTEGECYERYAEEMKLARQR